jgi:hypothetical protein
VKPIASDRHSGRGEQPERYSGGASTSVAARKAELDGFARCGLTAERRTRIAGPGAVG